MKNKISKEDMEKLKKDLLIGPRTEEDIQKPVKHKTKKDIYPGKNFNKKKNHLYK